MSNDPALLVRLCRSRELYKAQHSYGAVWCDSGSRDTARHNHSPFIGGRVDADALLLMERRGGAANCLEEVTLAVILNQRIPAVEKSQTRRNRRNSTTWPTQGMAVFFPLLVESKSEANCPAIRWEYVRSFESDDALLPDTWIVVRIDGRGFHK